MINDCQVGRASRNSQLHLYLADQREDVVDEVAATHEVQRVTRLNTRAMAISHNPDLFTRGRGRFHWERGVDEDAAKSITHRGNEDRLQQFL